jgi:protein TonB
MKKVLFSLLVVLLSQVGIAQETAVTQNIEQVHSGPDVDVQPQFPGGNVEFGNYVQRHYKYPNVRFLKGRVFIEFVVDVDGSIVDIKVLRDLGFGTGQEAVRLMGNCPKWIPGMINGKPVRVRYSLPIVIDIQ